MPTVQLLEVELQLNKEIESWTPSPPEPSAAVIKVLRRLAAAVRNPGGDYLSKHMFCFDTSLAKPSPIAAAGSAVSLAAAILGVWDGSHGSPGGGASSPMEEDGCAEAAAAASALGSAGRGEGLGPEPGTEQVVAAAAAACEEVAKDEEDEVEYGGNLSVQGALQRGKQGANSRMAEKAIC
jgi:hypothetical protein